MKPACTSHCTAWGALLDRRALHACLRTMAVALCQKLHLPNGTNISLHLVDDATIARANATFMDCSGPTNVLSFPQEDSLCGSLLLSQDTLFRECSLYGQDAREHCIRLLAHGLCHVAGLDHGPEMHRLTSELVDIAQQSPDFPNL